MKKTLKEYRKINNLSQQELSDVSGVSIRTIQRIEKNLSQGSPFILKSLCNALNIDASTLYIDQLDEEEEALLYTQINSKNAPIGKLNLINLSALFIIIFPFFNLLFPILLFLKFKKQETNKNEISKILSFQILWTLITILLVFVITAMIVPFFEILSSGRFPFYVGVYYLCVVFNVYITIDTAIKLNKSKEILPFVPNIL